MEKINYKSDFSFLLSLTNAQGEGIGFPDYDFKLVIRNKGSFCSGFVVSCTNGVMNNCASDHGRIRVVCDSHGLGPGELTGEFYADIPNAVFADGKELTVTPFPLGITLTAEAGAVPSDFEVSLLVPYVYVSAYEIAKAEGFQGTAEEFVAALVRATELSAEVGNIKDDMSFAQDEIVGIRENQRRLLGLLGSALTTDNTSPLEVTITYDDGTTETLNLIRSNGSE